MSKKTKTKPLFAVIPNEDALAAAANRYVELSLKLQKKKAAHEQRLAEANTEFDQDTAELVAEIAGLEAGCQLFAETHRELFPEDAKDGPRSRAYRNAVIGFRWNPFKVEKRVGKDTFEAIAERLGAVPWGEPYLRQADPVVDKDALLKNQAELTEDQLATVGIKFTRGETFFIDPVFETAEAVRKEAA
jgi:phage host-nuclease inhibitor protein Gam